MRTYQLCTYRFTTAAAAVDYLPRWLGHIDSLKPFEVQTHGYFSVPNEPEAVVALISYPDGVDPEAAMHDYMQSEGFKEDMSGFDFAQIITADKRLLRPGAGLRFRSRSRTSALAASMKPPSFSRRH